MTQPAARLPVFGAPEQGPRFDRRDAATKAMRIEMIDQFRRRYTPVERAISAGRMLPAKRSRSLDPLRIVASLPRMAAPFAAKAFALDRRFAKPCRTERLRSRRHRSQLWEDARFVGCVGPKVKRLFSRPLRPAGTPLMRKRLSVSFRSRIRRRASRRPRRALRRPCPAASCGPSAVARPLAPRPAPTGRDA